MKCSVIQDTDAPALHRARKDDGYSVRRARRTGRGGEVDRPPREKGAGERGHGLVQRCARGAVMCVLSVIGYRTIGASLF